VNKRSPWAEVGGIRHYWLMNMVFLFGIIKKVLAILMMAAQRCGCDSYPESFN
jgi:hypothetical protein